MNDIQISHFLRFPILQIFKQLLNEYLNPFFLNQHHLKSSVLSIFLIYTIGSVQAASYIDNSPSTITLTSTPISYESSNHSTSRVWVINPDDDSVSILDPENHHRIKKIAVGHQPNSVAVSPNGTIWVSNKLTSTISVIDAQTLTITRTITLPNASQPNGVVFSPVENSAFIVLESIGLLLKLDASTGTLLSHLNLGLNIRQIAITPNGKQLLVTKFITPPLLGESTSNIDSRNSGGEVFLVNPFTMTLNKIIKLSHQDLQYSDSISGGIPNYLGAPAISPDSTNAWIPSKQDNIKWGRLRNGFDLTADHAISAISSNINLNKVEEDLNKRVHHPFSGLATSAIYHPNSNYLFVTLETSREVAVIDITKGMEIKRVKVGRAPQGMTLSPDGNTLYVHNYMDRSVSIIDITFLGDDIELSENSVIASLQPSEEKLSAEVLSGKQLFYDALDQRLSNKHAISCAACHHDGGGDGRVWDMTSLGEGLRNTISLKKHGNLDERYFNWSANADELQDIEHFIRFFSGGTGLMNDSDFYTGSRNQALGDKKAGISQDLDHLSAYIKSINRTNPNPYLQADGTLTSSALLGKKLYISQCMSCHTNQANSMVPNIGTIKPESGMRLAAELNQMNTPSLNDAWQTSPYLHDGSANTLANAILAHQSLEIDKMEIQSIVDYVLQISGDQNLAISVPTKSTKLTADNEINPIKKSTSNPASILSATNKIIKKTLEKVSTKATVPVVPNQPPTISIQTPVNNSTFLTNQTITLSANASDSDGTIVKVEFYNGSTLLSTVTASPFSFVLSNLAVGNYAITAKAYDNSGASTTSSPINYVVNQIIPNQLPSVSITTPEINGSFTAGQTITIGTKVEDSDGTINRVEFYNGSTLVSTSTTAPFIHTYTNASAGTYTMTAKAFDNSGGSTTSTPITFTVLNSNTITPINTLSIYYIGNSVTDIINYGALANQLKSLVNTVKWGRHMIPGSPLNYIRDNSANGFMEAPYGYWPNALNNYSWDILSLQPFDRQIISSDGSDIGDLAQITNYAQLAANQNSNVQVYVYARWPRITINNGVAVDFDINAFDPTVPGSGVDTAGGTIDDYNIRWNGIYTGGFDNIETASFFESLVTQVRANTPFLNKPVLLVPVGYVFADLHQQMKNGNIDQFTDIHQLYKDAIHLNEIGSYIVRMTYYATIMKKSPVGLSSEGIDGLEPAFVQQIQETVWRIVKNHPLAGVK